MGKFQDIEVFTTCMGDENQNMVETYIIVFGIYLFFGESLEKSLVPTNHLRANGSFVYDVPKQFTKERSLHMIYIHEGYITIPCYMKEMF